MGILEKDAGDGAVWQEENTEVTEYYGCGEGHASGWHDEKMQRARRDQSG